MSLTETRPVHAGDPESLAARGLDPPGPVGSGAGRGLAVGPPTAPAIVIPDLPWAYEDDRLVLLVRDPRTLFAYWDFNPDTVRKSREAVPEGRPYLRLLMLGGSETRVVKEFEIDFDSRSYYLYELEANRDYRVEILLRNAAGAERLVGRSSNVATLPSNKPSSWVEDRFATMSPDVRLPVAALFKGGRPSVDLERRLHARAYDLSGGELATDHTGDIASSSQGIAQGFGGRSWSGTLVKK